LIGHGLEAEAGCGGDALFRAGSRNLSGITLKSDSSRDAA
jgi:hypothetical protein